MDMKNYLFYIIAGVLALTQTAICQTKKEYTDISYIKLTDTILIENINKEINEQLNTVDSGRLLKKGVMGYIDVYVNEFPQKDTIIHYSILPSLYPINETAADSRYPEYYTYVNDRLVVIYLKVLNQFTERVYSEKSKKHIRKLIDNVVDKPHKSTFYDMNGKKLYTNKKNRIDYNFVGALSIYILKNKPPIFGREY